MWATESGGPVIVIGENIHATRVVLRGGKHVTVGGDGDEAIRYTDADGRSRLLPVPSPIREGQDFAAGRIKPVAAAFLAARGEGPGAEAGSDFVRALALRQQAAGADYLDLNVDEISADPSQGMASMRWLVGVVEEVAAIPVALDSSSAEVIAAGVEASSRDHRQLLLNSASVERLDVLDLAARTGCAVVLSASGRMAMPSTAEERVENGRAIITAALERGIPLERLHVDALVVPAAVDPEAGNAFLDAVRRLRAEYGPDIHLTGGISNVSFGLPARRLLNETFLWLATDAGADSAILDPLTSDPSRAFAAAGGDRARDLATSLLTGDDPFGVDYLAAHRAGALASLGA